jgi:uncharacterized protein YceH (UPF0502 family)
MLCTENAILGCLLEEKKISPDAFPSKEQQLYIGLVSEDPSPN